jgi:hypothetical protein
MSNNKFDDIKKLIKFPVSYNPVDNTLEDRTNVRLLDGAKLPPFSKDEAKIVLPFIAESINSYLPDQEKIERLEKEKEKLIEALGIYANEHNWQGCSNPFAEIKKDWIGKGSGFDLAKQALEAEKHK